MTLEGDELFDAFWRPETTPMTVNELIQAAAEMDLPEIEGVDCIVILVDKRTKAVGWASTIAEPGTTTQFFDILHRLANGKAN